MRQVDAPKTNVSPVRHSKTISSSSSPTRTGLPLAPGEKDTIEPAIGNRAAIQDREQLCALARRQSVARAVPRDPGTKLGEFIRRITARQQIENPIKGLAAEIAEWSGSPYQREELLDLNFRRRKFRVWCFDSLCSDCRGERRPQRRGGCATMATICCASTSSGIAQKPGRLDQFVVHRAGDGRTGDKVGAILRKMMPSLAIPT